MEMDCTCIRYTDLPHTSKLFADFLYHPDRVRRFYSFSSLEHSAETTDIPPERRAALIDALRPLNPASAALDRLAQPGTVAVVTGQQVGLFSGPAYTVYKAVTAVRLAEELTARGIPAVPVFWLATEDHDFAEINHAWVFDPEHRPVKLEMHRSSSGQPVGDLPLVAPPVDGLRQALKGFAFAEETIAMVAESYGSGRTVGQAFSALLKSLLARFDLVHVDPMAPAMRQLAAPAIRSALEAAPQLNAAVRERNNELAAAGYHAQVHVGEQTSFVFLLENGRRLALRRSNGDYILNGRRFSTKELQDRASELSPNALLRPVVQDSILPTVAYVGGPAELAYLAQSEVIYRQLLGRMPVAMHRAGFTILDQRAHKLLERYSLHLADFFHGDQALRERIASRLIPAPLADTLTQSRERADAAIGRLMSDLETFDGSVAKAVARSRRKIDYQLGKIERKVGREMLARDERAERDAGYLDGLIFPHKNLQERLYSILPFVARYGPTLVDTLYEGVRLSCPDHQLVVL